MKDFLYYILIEPFTDNDWMSYVLGVFMWLLLLLIVGGLFWLSVWLIDSSFMPVKEKDGVVTNKYIVPAYITTTYVMNGGVVTPITTYHDTTYNLEITIDKLEDDVCVYENYYDSISVGQKVHCEYTNGRIKKSLYIKSLIYELQPPA